MRNIYALGRMADFLTSHEPSEYDRMAANLDKAADLLDYADALQHLLTDLSAYAHRHIRIDDMACEMLDNALANAELAESYLEYFIDYTNHIL